MFVELEMLTTWPHTKFAICKNQGTCSSFLCYSLNNTNTHNANNLITWTMMGKERFNSLPPSIHPRDKTWNYGQSNTPNCLISVGYNNSLEPIFFLLQLMTIDWGHVDFNPCQNSRWKSVRVTFDQFSRKLVCVTV